MVRGFMVGVGSAAVLMAGVVGCSGNKSDSIAESEKPPAPSSAMSATSGSMTATAGTGTAKVSIDGQPKDVQGQITCAKVNEDLNISIGDYSTGVAVVVSPDASTVKQVGLGDVNGVTLGYQQGAGGGANASAAKDGNTYKITGTASGVDMANPTQSVTKPFEITVTCP